MFMVCPYPYHAPTGLSNSMSLLAIAAFAALAGAGPVPPRVSRLSGFPFSLYGGEGSRERQPRGTRQDELAFGA